MTSISIIVRVILNGVLFVLYFFMTHALIGFVTGWFIKRVLGYPVPPESALLWNVLAVISILCVFIITTAWRKHFYLCLDTTQNKGN